MRRHHNRNSRRVIHVISTCLSPLCVRGKVYGISSTFTELTLVSAIVICHMYCCNVSDDVNQNAFQNMSSMSSVHVWHMWQNVQFIFNLGCDPSHICPLDLSRVRMRALEILLRSTAVPNHGIMGEVGAVPA